MSPWGMRWRKWTVAGVLALLVLGLTAPLAAGATGTSYPALLERIIRLVEAFYYKPVDPEDLWRGAIDGALEALGDPYTAYLSPEDLDSFTDDIEGHFVGVGIRIEQVGSYIVVQAPIKGSPAEAAGLQPGDRVLEVDGRSLVGEPTETAVRLIRGEPGTPVTLRIERPSEGRVFEVTLIRAEVQIPIVEAEYLGDGIGYIQVHTFSSDLAHRFGQAAAGLRDQGMRGLILDLRNNPGGYLDAAVDLAGFFVPPGEPVVLEVEGDGKPRPRKAAGRPLGLPTVVLVNAGTASASEVVAGALQDYGLATLVGTRTFGKGTVQTLIHLPDQGALKVTTAEYLTPKGRRVHEVGLEPDVKVEALPISPDRFQPIELEQAYAPGEVGLAIQAVQQRLNDLGYNAGPENGFFSQRLKAAIEAFQRDHGLRVSGLIDRDLVKTLNQAVAEHLAQLRQRDVQKEKAVEVLRGILASR
ncbi:MAG: S41 family peptidase [Firmicutes bacterium]|nr:S41 family peptidase [Bacillota bacterium]